MIASLDLGLAFGFGLGFCAGILFLWIVAWALVLQPIKRNRNRYDR